MSESNWECDLGNGEFDHDWEYDHDSAGDGSHTVHFGCKRCTICGHSEEMDDDDFNDLVWID
jgi:hypothetical protein